MTKFLGHFGPPRQRNSQNTAKNGPFWPFLARKLITIIVQPITIPYRPHNGPYEPKNVTTGSGGIACNFPSTAPPNRIASSGLHAHFSAAKRPFWPPTTGSPPGAHNSPKRHFSTRPYLRNQATPGRTNVLYPHLNHGFGGECGMYGPVTLKIDGEMKFDRPARGRPLAWATPGGAATHDSAKFRVRKNRDQKNRKKS